MAWKDINSWNSSRYGSDLVIHLQYDDSSLSYESIMVRVILTIPSSYKTTSYSGDAWCLLWGDPKNNVTYNIKGPNTNWGAANPDSIKVTKAPSDRYYTIPSFWVCISGHELPFYYNGKPGYLSYGSGAGVTDTVYNWFNGSRSGYKQEIAAQTLGTVWYYEDGNLPTISVADNGNNTITVTGRTGTQGTNNPVTNAWLHYTTNGQDPSSGTSYTTSLPLSCTAGGNDIYTKVLNVPASNTTFKLTADTRFTYKNSNGYYSRYANTNITPAFYGAPRFGANDKPSLHRDSYKNNRLTIKKDWKFTWPAATATGSSSIEGYRIRLYKNGALIRGLVYNKSTKTLTSSAGTSDYVDTGDATCYVTFNPNDFGFKSKDTVYIGIYAYSLNAKGEVAWDANNIRYVLFNDGGAGSGQKSSDAITVQNAGVVHVKVGSQWKEGQVWVRVGNTWKEAETVNVKTATGWKESQ